MKETIKSIVKILFCTLLTFIAGCDKKVQTVTPAPPSNEFLTTVQLLLQNQNDATDTMKATWRQLDPTGTNPPDTSEAMLNLKANSVYNAQVVLLDETKTPPDIVSVTIKERANYHLLFFQPTPIQTLVISDTSTDIIGTATSDSGPYLNLWVDRTDYDSNNPPLQVGLTDVFKTGSASAGRLQVVLRHQPNVKNGTYPPGSTDFDVNFTININ